jgi:hypothetical protein
MNTFAENGDRFIVPFTRIGFPEGFEVCWAGPHPFEQGFCFGSLDGRILFTDEEGVQLIPLEDGSVSKEAINGIARVEIWVAVSTRQEVNFKRLLGTEGSPRSRLMIPYGAHDITTTASGYFIAPLGRTGMMALRPPFTPETRVTIYSFAEGLYTYRVIGLRSFAGTEVLACACRLGGIAVGEFSGAQQKLPMTAATFKGLDVVDICPLDPGADSLAAAALGRDGTLILSRDVLQDKKPLTMKFSSVKGIAYRALSCRGDIYLLTSKGLYVLGELASRFLDKKLVNGITTPVLPLSMEAVDMNLAANRWLLVVMANEVRKFDVELIHQSIPDQLRDGEFQEFQEAALNPDWERFDIEQTTKEICAVA